MDQLGTRTGTSLYISQHSADSESTLPLSTTDWRIVSLARAKQQTHLARLEQTKQEWSRPEQNCLAKEGLPQGFLTQRPPCRYGIPQHAVSHLSCTTIEILHNCATPQTCCIMIKLFALNKISFFTASKIGDSFWMLNWCQRPSVDSGKHIIKQKLGLERKRSLKTRRKEEASGHLITLKSFKVEGKTI